MSGLFFVLIFHFLDKPILAHRTTTGDSYYKGQRLTVSCTAPKVSADTAFYLLAMNIGTGSIQCQLSSGQWTSGHIGDLSGIEYSAITNDDCNLPMNANTITVNFNITEGLKDKEITCQLPVTNTISDSTLNILQLKSKYFITLALHEPLMLLQKVLSPQLFSTKPRVSFSFFFV